MSQTLLEMAKDLMLAQKAKGRGYDRKKTARRV